MKTKQKTKFYPNKKPLVTKNILYAKKITKVFHIQDEIVLKYKSRNFKSNIKKKINNKLKYWSNKTIKHKRKSNSIANSYLNRFLAKKNRKLYNKTVGLNLMKDLTFAEETELYQESESLIKKEQDKFSYKGFFKGFSHQVFNFSKTFKSIIININHARKNTFIIISEIINNTYNFLKTATKFSCGLLGFRGPKKDTRYAREQTLKAAGNFVGYHKYNFVTVNYSSHASFWNKRALRLLLTYPIFVKVFNIFYNRSHGFLRKQKGRRV